MVSHDNFDSSLLSTCLLQPNYGLFFENIFCLYQDIIMERDILEMVWS